MSEMCLMDGWLLMVYQYHEQTERFKQALIYFISKIIAKGIKQTIFAFINYMVN